MRRFAVTLLAVAFLASGCSSADAPVPSTSSVVETAVPTTDAGSSPTSARPSLPSAEPSATPSGNAAKAVTVLAVKGRAAKTGYSRAQFGPAWVDIERNGCDSRNDMLALYLTNKVMSGSCKVMSGTLADPYTGTSIVFVHGGVSEVDIDHLVALSDAWQTGATQWAYAKRVAFANDPLNLQPSAAGANRQKGDSDAASWLPPNTRYRCTYVARQVAVKTKYRLWVTAAEGAAMLSVLSTCPSQNLPRPGPQPTIASNTGGSAPATSPRPTPSRTTSPPSSGLDKDYGTCAAAKAAGKGPYYEGKDPEYDWYIDRDKDGMVCE